MVKLHFNFHLGIMWRTRCSVCFLWLVRAPPCELGPPGEAFSPVDETMQLAVRSVWTGGEAHGCPRPPQANRLSYKQDGQQDGETNQLGEKGENFKM